MGETMITCPHQEGGEEEAYPGGDAKPHDAEVAKPGRGQPSRPPPPAPAVGGGEDDERDRERAESGHERVRQELHPDLADEVVEAADGRGGRREDEGGRDQALLAASAWAPGKGHDAEHGEKGAGRDREGEPFPEKDDGERRREQGERSPRRWR